MEEIFDIKTEIKGINFVGNRETGKWVITNKFNEDVRRKISRSKSLCSNCFKKSWEKFQSS